MAGLRRKRSAQQGMRELEEQRTRFASDLERAEAVAETARAAVEEARRQDAAAYLGDVAEDVAKRALAEATGQLEAAEQELARLQAVAPELERRLADQREAIRLEQLAAAEGALQEALTTSTGISSRLAAALEKATAEHAELIAARETVKERRQVVSELGGDRFATQADETPWPNVRELVEFLMSSKPLRPVADEERAARQQEHDAANEERRERAHWLEQARALAYLTNTPEVMERKRELFFADVPEHLRDEVIAAFRATRDEVEANRDSIRLQRV